MTTIDIKNIKDSDIKEIVKLLSKVPQSRRNKIANQIFSNALRKASSNIHDVTTFNPEALQKQFDIIND